MSAQPLDRMAETLFDDAAAQTHFPVVEDGGLARGHRSLLLVEDDPDGLIVDGLDQAGDIFLPIAGLDGAAARRATVGQCAAMVMAGMSSGDAAAPDLIAYSPFWMSI